MVQKTVNKLTKCIIHSNINLYEGGDNLVKDTIQAIKDTEQKAEELIEKAKKEAVQMTEDAQKEAAQIEKVIMKKAKKLLEQAKLFDIYRNEKLGENKKSVAYSLIFRDKKKTLSDEEVNIMMENIIAELEKTLGAELRK